jgi:hypothetical protein
MPKMPMMSMTDESDDSAKLEVLEEIRALMDKLDADQVMKAMPKLAGKEEKEPAAEDKAEGGDESDDKKVDPDIAKLKALAK